jgi:hypothetical protein
MKTGSTTLQNIVDRLAAHTGLIVGPNHTDPMFSPLIESQWQSFVLEKGGRLDFYNQHINYNKFLAKPEYWRGARRPLILTMLRRPYDQCNSHFRYYFRHCAPEKDKQYGRRRRRLPQEDEFDFPNILYLQGEFLKGLYSGTGCEEVSYRIYLPYHAI